MGLFGKKKEETKTAATNNPQCDHPVAYQSALKEDPNAPFKVTGIKCMRCGARLQMQKA